MKYRVTFERIGRNHSIAPLVADAANDDELTDRIAAYARSHLHSEDYGVAVDLDAGQGNIVCGFHCGGDFTIEALPAARSAAEPSTNGEGVNT